MRVADLLLKYLELEGVEYIFGVPGNTLSPLYRALLENRGKLKPILAKHEEGAAFMADGYARVSGKLGVCCADVGPGSTNLITGITTAYFDSIPVLALTGQHPLEKLGKGALHESTRAEDADIVQLFRSITKYSGMAPTSKTFSETLRKAIRMALTGRKGPVHLSLPISVMQEEIDEAIIPPNRYRVQPRYCDREPISDAVRMVLKAKQPAILAGYGVVLSQATHELRRFAERLCIPVATTPKAKSAFPEDHLLALGCFGFAGSKNAYEYLLSDDTDLVLLVGTSTNEMGTACWHPKLGANATLIHIDIDPSVIGKNYPVTLGIVGDAKTVLDELLVQLTTVLEVEHQKRTFPEKFLMQRTFHAEEFSVEGNFDSDAAPIKPQRLMRDLSDSLPMDAIVFVDAGRHLAWAIHYLKSFMPGTFITALGFAPMGYGIAAAIGGQLAQPHRKVISICGDGCFLMHGMEIQTAVEYALPITFLVFNDAKLGYVYFTQKKLFSGRTIATSFQRVDFVKVAEGLGAEGIRVEEPSDIRTALKAALHSPRPTVIDVIVDAEEIPPTFPEKPISFWKKLKNSIFVLRENSHN